MKIIGLTGGIASGKSTVSKYLKSCGYIIVDADEIARKAVNANSDGLMKLVDEFGSEILDKENILNRKKLASIVFSDTRKLNILNNILHPIIRKMIFEEFDYHKKNNQDIIIFDCPLLFESSYQDICDETWLVSISHKTQLNRLMKRDNIDQEKAIKIINSQMSLEEKSKLADYIINNESTVEDLYEQLEELLTNKYYIL